jgi:Family of unknown function (DUF6114)
MVRPVVAPILTIVGGGFIAVGGAVLAFIGTILATVFGFSSALYLVGLAVGLLTIAAGALLWLLPSGRRPIGIVVMLLAALSVPFAFGGFVVGFLLAVMGGVMAIVTRPPNGPVPASPAAARAPPWG